MVRIVILGGGFAGTTAARRLEQIFGADAAVEITLVDRENFSLFTPLLPEVPSGAIEAKHIVSPLRAILGRTVIRQAEVRAVDLSKRLVLAAHCPNCQIYLLPYDHLVVALGSVTNFFGLPGVATHALTMKSLTDASALHAHVVDKFEHADMEPDPQTRRELLTFMVAGGGFAGVETAGELNDFVRGAGRFYPRVKSGEVRVILVHPETRILPEVSESLSAYALKKLRSRGVEVRLETRIEDCDGIRVRLSSGEAIGTRTLVWTAGVTANPLLAAIDIPRTAGGKVRVRETLEVEDHPGIWALGDCAFIIDAATGRPYPPTAQHAIRQGRRMAENIAAVIRGRTPTPFSHKPVGILAGLGRRSAVAEILGLRFSGFFAWWLWRTIYLFKLPGVERKVRVALDWTLDLFFPRDIVYLRPLHLAHGSEPLVEAPSTPAARDPGASRDHGETA
ncbi:MAG: NAD(P)/FAD-dependent oxidoreductase [Candidatus Rokubacteria bacterium]|nr:NAD(P)/FAD-dependent oxidoreductase [Candidatus Rokubacteria bacterium]